MQLQIDKFAHLATGTFLRHLRRRLLAMIAIAVVPIVVVVLYPAKLRRDVQILELHEAAWRLTNVIVQRQSQLVDSVKQMLVLLAQMPEIGMRFRISSRCCKPSTTAHVRQAVCIKHTR